MLVVAWDAKVYELILSLKFECGEALKCVIPYPGDWHSLKIYQLPLMEADFDSWLKALAKTCGYPLASIQSCGQFKRTQQNILEVWEAMYRAILETFLYSRDINTSRSQNTSTYILQLLLNSIHSLQSCNFAREFNNKLSEHSKSTIEFFEDFKNLFS